MENLKPDLFQSGRHETHTDGACGATNNGEEPWDKISSVGEAGNRVVYVVDDHSDVRKAIHLSLAAVGIMAWSFATAQDFLEQSGDLAPAPVLLDLRMPKIDGLETLAILRSKGIHWPVIMMSAHGEISMAVRSMQLGALDFLEKPFCFDDLADGLKRGFGMLEQAFKADLLRRRAQQRLATLTPRETEVLHQLVTGLSNRAVGGRLGLSERTVETHRSNLLAKLGSKSLTKAVLLLGEAKGGPDFA